MVQIGHLLFGGGMHGLAQVIENTFSKRRKDNKNIFWKLISIAIVYTFCTLAWVFFRADNISDAFFVLTHMFDGLSRGKDYFSNSIGLGYYQCARIGIMILILAVYDALSLKYDVIDIVSKQKIIVRWLLYVLLVMIIFLFANVGNNSFIYFQF